MQSNLRKILMVYTFLNITSKEIKELSQCHVGPLFHVNASNEIILSAGTVGSAQILLNSGIGNSTTLSELGIPPLVHLPSVGHNLTDQPLTTNTFIVNSTMTYDDINRNATVSDEVYTEFNKTGMGPLVDTFANQISFFRVNKSLTEEFGDPSSGRNSPHLEIYPGVSTCASFSELLYLMFVAGRMDFS